MSVGVFFLLVVAIIAVLAILLVGVPALLARFGNDAKAMRNEITQRRQVMSEIRQEAIRYQQIEGQLPNVILDILNRYEFKELS